MDPTRFDHLTRRLAGASGRRTLLRAVLGAALGAAAPVFAEKGPGNGQGKGQGHHHTKKHKPGGKGGGTGGGGAGGGSATPCCGTAACLAPKAGALRKGCDYQSQDFSGAALRGGAAARHRPHALQAVADRPRAPRRRAPPGPAPLRVAPPALRVRAPAPPHRHPARDGRDPPRAGTGPVAHRAGAKLAPGPRALAAARGALPRVPVTASAGFSRRTTGKRSS